jgi:TonB family protein
MLPHPESQFVDTPTLFVEARFRGRVVAARLMSAGTSRPFTIGAARRADAPVDRAFLPPDVPANDNHELISPSRAGFVLNLSPAMRARVDRSTYGLRVPCGEVVFDIREAALEPALPRPWLARRWRAELPYTLGVAAALLLVVGILAAVPSDPRALSFDDFGRSLRFDVARVVPEVIVAPPLAGDARGPAGATAPVAAGSPGARGERRAPRVDEPHASRSASTVRDAASAAEAVRQSPLLALLDEKRSTALERVLGGGSALGEGADDTLEHLVATSLDRGYASSGLDGGHGTGASDAGTGEGIIGLGILGLPGHDHFGRGSEFSRRAGVLATLHDRQARSPAVINGFAAARGGLDKELVRRVVRAHLNEVRFCYSEALARQPALAGRVVVQFTIAHTGRVLVSALQSSSLGSATVEQCIVAATRRWEYPRPSGGGLVSVSYPFQLVPTGG